MGGFYITYWSSDRVLARDFRKDLPALGSRVPGCEEWKVYQVVCVGNKCVAHCIRVS